MTPTILDRLEKLASEATDGKWEYDLDENEVHASAHQELGGDPLHIIPPSGEYVILRNGPFIAAANPATILTLIKVIRLQTEALQEIELEPNATNCKARGIYGPGACAHEALAESDKLLEGIGT